MKDAQEGFPVMETELIAFELRGIPRSRKVCPISAEKGVKEACLLCPPPLLLVPRDCLLSLLLTPVEAGFELAR
jgi:hypothetical protein